MGLSGLSLSHQGPERLRGAAVPGDSSTGRPGEQQPDLRDGVRRAYRGWGGDARGEGEEGLGRAD